MSAGALADPLNAAGSGSKKKPKKKKSKAKPNGENSKDNEIEKEAQSEVGDVDADVEDSKSVVSTANTANTANESLPADDTQVRVNGSIKESPSNGHPTTTQGQSIIEQIRAAKMEQATEIQSPSSPDFREKIEATTAEREALRAEIEQLRKSLENVQAKHTEELSTITRQHGEELGAMFQKHKEEITPIATQHAKELQSVRTELEESEAAKEQAETQYQSLLGRVNTIKATLGERLKADKQELAEAREQIQELESQNESLQRNAKEWEKEVARLREDINESSKELSSLRNRHNLSQQNWVHEREDLIQQTRQLKDEADAAKEAMGEWEVLAMEERSIRENVETKISDMEDQFSSQKEAYEEALAERDSQSQAVDGLQRALKEIQETRKRELREMVESSEEQLQALKKVVQESDSKCIEAEASKTALQAELDRLLPFEKEVKEKNLLIGKLRHEAIVLNDHLTKALRFLKKAKPEDNVDRQIVTNHFLQFLALDRSDPKKFQILQLIAALLNWTDEQKEQAGLARPGASSSTLRLPVSPFFRTPSTPSLSTEFLNDSSNHNPAGRSESLADLWTGFLERSAEEGSAKDSRSGSVSSSVATRPETRGGA